MSRNSASCLTGGTLIYIEKPSAIKQNCKMIHMKMTIEELYNKYNYGDSIGRSLKNRIKSLNLRCLNEDNCSFTTTTIKNIIYSGEQDVYKVTLNNGYNITCTDTHRLYTEKGWTTLKEQNLSVGTVISWNKDFPKVATNGFELTKEFLIKEKEAGKSRKQISEETGIKYKTVSYYCDKFGIRFRKKIIPNEILTYLDEDWLLDRKEEGLTNGRIAELCNTTEDRVKKACVALDVTGYKGSILKGNARRKPWNTGKRYHHKEESLVKVREAAKRRIKKDSYKLYKDFNSKLVRFMQECREEILKKYNFKCQITGSIRNLEIHHIIPIWYDKSKAFDRDNLIVVNRDIHNQIHGRHLDLKFMEYCLSGKDLSLFFEDYKDIKLTIDEINKPKPPGNTLVARFYNIKSIEYMGKQKTYDIEVEGPYHNFVANGIIVHNSRAIPVGKIISYIRTKPAMPVYWGKNQKGMQADEELPESVILESEQIWLESMESQIKYAEKLLKLGVHKQITNRLLEPFFNITTLVSATDFSNFFNLRAHPDAQPEFQELAFCMLEEYEKSTPKQLKEGEWHLPFSNEYIEDGLSTEQLLKITTARAARVSYMNFEGNIDYEKDYKLHDDLKKAGHFSCFEHAAKTEEDNKYYANFRGFIQYRKFISGENRTEYNPEQLKADRRHFKR